MLGYGTDRHVHLRRERYTTSKICEAICVTEEGFAILDDCYSTTWAMKEVLKAFEKAIRLSIISIVFCIMPRS